MSNNYVLLSNGGFAKANVIYHHGIEGQKWGVRRYQNEDGTLTAMGKSRLRGYDGEESDWYSDGFRNAESYVNSWERNYGTTPINRLRFEYNDRDGVKRGRDYCQDYDWNNTKLDDIYDSYREYRDSEDWD